jgi:hypothetical protein
MNRSFAVLLLLGALLHWPTPAYASTILYGVDGSGGLYTLSTSTGKATLVAKSPDGFPSLAGLAFLGQEMYVCFTVAASQQDSGRLFRVDGTDERCEVGKPLLITVQRVGIQHGQQTLLAGNRFRFREGEGRREGGAESSAASARNSAHQHA